MVITLMFIAKMSKSSAKVIVWFNIMQLFYNISFCSAKL